MRITPPDLRERLRRDVPSALYEFSAQTDGTATDGAANGIDDGFATSGARSDMLATDDVVVAAEALPAVACYLRDTLGYALLSNVTAVDYLRENIIEMVYHFLNVDAGGSPLVIKVRVPRNAPIVPTLSLEWPGADLQEREAFDLFGVQFPGHPDLRRIYMWDEFEGWPMRKDFPKQGDKYFEF